MEGAVLRCAERVAQGVLSEAPGHIYGDSERQGRLLPGAAPQPGCQVSSVPSVPVPVLPSGPRQAAPGRDLWDCCWPGAPLSLPPAQPCLTAPVPPCRTGCPAWHFRESQGNHPASIEDLEAKLLLLGAKSPRNKPVKASSDQSQPY
ncbi:protein tyrosine phosphatase type IVA 2 isoform X3 [Passer montanus]|uniref:protein tyrosine phosphatase type IVA 2 isoform X3 n=1 Tax=Passer montanus TaxID=9160 RepID=UPI001960BEEC|nr:protein tyrosine phosphatase type IVA 2 isoform X3 [Passer montanus]